MAAFRSIDSANPKVVEKIRTEADYFESNAVRMCYRKFRRQHLFVGSGVIEAGCRAVIGSRLKQSEVFWTVWGAKYPRPACGIISHFKSHPLAAALDAGSPDPKPA